MGLSLLTHLLAPYFPTDASSGRVPEAEEATPSRWGWEGRTGCLSQPCFLQGQGEQKAAGECGLAVAPPPGARVPNEVLERVVIPARANFTSI